MRPCLFMRPTTTRAKTATLTRLRRLSRLLDSAFRIPIINYRVGLDAVVGLVPGVGDAVMLAPALYIIFEAYRLGAPTGTLARMVFNVGLETLIGSVPLLGDLFDATWKANLRNLRLLEQHLGPGTTPTFEAPSNRGLVLLLGALLILGGGVFFLVWALFGLIGRIF